MAPKGILHRLRTADFFKGLSDPTLHAIASLCSTRSLRKEQVLFTEDSPGENIFLLTTGMFKLFKDAAEGKPALIHLVKPGDLFAEVVLFERETYPVTAIATQASSVVAIPKRGFLKLLDERQAREEFLKILMGKLRLLTRHVRRLTSDNLEDRFFGFLEDHFGKARTIKPEMSKKDMAGALGVTPEALSRFLTRMKKDGRLTWERGIITLRAAPKKIGIDF